MKIKRNLHAELAGRYKLVTRLSDGTVTKETDWFDNIITNKGLDILGVDNYLRQCRVGTGSATPAPTDTSLQSALAVTATILSTSFTSSAVSPYYSAIVRTFRFGVGVAAGNLTEVGIFQSVATDSCGSRALIVDGMGDPITLTVLSNEILDVVYELRTYMMEVDGTGTVVLDSVDYDWTARSANAASGNQYGLTLFGAEVLAYRAYPATGAIAAVTSAPTGTVGFQFMTPLPYSNGDYYRDYTSTWGVEADNFGWNSIVTTSGSGLFGPVFQVGLDPTFDKTSAKIVTLVFRLSWARKV